MAPQRFHQRSLSLRKIDIEGIILVEVLVEVKISKQENRRQQMKNIKKSPTLMGAARIVKSLILIFVLSLFVLSNASAMEAAIPSSPSTSTKPIKIRAIYGVSELGLLVLGVAWDAVRIVMPKSCPERDKDIDELVRTIKEKKSEK